MNLFTNVKGLVAVSFALIAANSAAGITPEGLERIADGLTCGRVLVNVAVPWLDKGLEKLIGEDPAGGHRLGNGPLQQGRDGAGAHLLQLPARGGAGNQRMQNVREATEMLEAQPGVLGVLGQQYTQRIAPELTPASCSGALVTAAIALIHTSDVARAALERNKSLLAEFADNVLFAHCDGTLVALADDAARPAALAMVATRTAASLCEVLIFNIVNSMIQSSFPDKKDAVLRRMARIATGLVTKAIVQGASYGVLAGGWAGRGLDELPDAVKANLKIEQRGDELVRASIPPEPVLALGYFFSGVLQAVEFVLAEIEGHGLATAVSHGTSAGDEQPVAIKTSVISKLVPSSTTDKAAALKIKTTGQINAA